MSAHTPGPWQVNMRDPLQVCDADGDVRGCAPIAKIAAIGSLRECRANARLIAAAPMLLEALEALYAVAPSKAPAAGLIVGIEDRHANACAMARTAIKAAKGQA